MLKYVGPLIVTDDMPASRHFYETLLGQKVEMDFGANVSFVGGFAIHLKSHYEGLLGDASKFPITLKANNGELYFECDGLDPLYQRLIDADVKFIHPIVEQPWAQQVMRFYDPSGYIVEVGETMESVVKRLHLQGWPVERICEKTLMPQEFVEQAIQGISG